MAGLVDQKFLGDVLGSPEHQLVALQENRKQKIKEARKEEKPSSVSSSGQIGDGAGQGDPGTLAE